MATPPRNPIPTSVYRYYDAADILIYIGITSTGTERNRQHNADKAWWKWVARQEVEHFPSRADALGREKALIQKFRPPFNSVHNRDAFAIRTAYVSAREAGLFDTAGVEVVPMEHRRFRMDVSDADWCLGVVELIVTATQTAAVTRLKSVPGVNVYEQRVEQRGKKIGEVRDVLTIGGISRVTLKTTVGCRFRSVEVWLKPTNTKPQFYVLKQIAALDCERD